MNRFHYVAEHSEVVTPGLVVPAGLATKADLLRFLAIGIPLPNYFGHNWDALEECLSDLNTPPGTTYTLAHRDLPLAESAHDCRVYLKVLAEATGERLVVQFPEACRAEIQRLLA